jgi:hypothetical protein
LSIFALEGIGKYGRTGKRLDAPTSGARDCFRADSFQFGCPLAYFAFRPDEPGEALPADTKTNTSKNSYPFPCRFLLPIPKIKRANSFLSAYRKKGSSGNKIYY